MIPFLPTYHLEVIHSTLHRNKTMISTDSSSTLRVFYTRKPTSSMSFLVGSIPEFSRKCLKELLTVSVCIYVTVFKLLSRASQEAWLSDALSYLNPTCYRERDGTLRTDKGDFSFFFVNTVHSYRSQIVYY